MRIRPFKTNIHLPPGLLPHTRLRELLRLCLEEFCWFRPVRYGYASLNKRIDPDRPDIDSLIAFYDEWQALCVAARTDRDFISIHPGAPEFPFVGKVSWTTHETPIVKSEWRDTHAVHVFRIMELVDSPLAVAALDEDVQRKTQRLIPDGAGLTQVSTIRDYSEGLAGLFWRNFYGPPFVRLFGDRLTSLPAEYRRDLGNDIVLVEPYALPGDAGTEEGQARERSLIEHLGPECFYDHQRHTKPTRLPELSSLPVPRP